MLLNVSPLETVNKPAVKRSQLLTAVLLSGTYESLCDFYSRHVAAGAQLTPSFNSLIRLVFRGQRQHSSFQFHAQWQGKGSLPQKGKVNEQLESLAYSFYSLSLSYAKGSPPSFVTPFVTNTIKPTTKYPPPPTHWCVENTNGSRLEPAEKRGMISYWENLFTKPLILSITGLNTSEES